MGLVTGLCFFSEFFFTWCGFGGGLLRGRRVTRVYREGFCGGGTIVGYCVLGQGWGVLPCVVGLAGRVLALRFM